MAKMVRPRVVAAAVPAPPKGVDPRDIVSSGTIEFTPSGEVEAKATAEVYPAQSTDILERVMCFRERTDGVQLVVSNKTMRGQVVPSGPALRLYCDALMPPVRTSDGLNQFNTRLLVEAVRGISSDWKLEYFYLSPSPHQWTRVEPEMDYFLDVHDRPFSRDCDVEWAIPTFERLAETMRVILTLVGGDACLYFEDEV